MPYKDKEEGLKKGREYYWKNRERILKKKFAQRQKNPYHLKPEVKAMRKRWWLANKEKVAEHRKQYRHKEKSKAVILLNDMRRRAKDKNLAFDLDKNWIEQKIKNGKCDLTGILFSFKRPRKGYRVNPFTPSGDRLNPKKGYTKKNVKIVVWAVNISKWQWSLKDYTNLIKLIYKGLKKYGKIK